MPSLSQLRVIGGGVLFATVFLPLLGRIAFGAPLRGLWHFPPLLALREDFPRFSWFAVTGLMLMLALIALPWTACARRRIPPDERWPTLRRQSFPAWGWFALAWTLVWWVIAWIHAEPFMRARQHSFLPLWLGFILVLNAVVVSRMGSSFLIRAPRRWLALLLASAAFWWIFEWLNRFTENWHYVGVAHFSALRYFLHATACFGTVLPAVLAMRELLGSIPPFQRTLARGPILPLLAHPATVSILVISGGFGLFGLGAWPTAFYAAVWAAPLALLWALRFRFTDSGMLRELAAGDWRRPATWALAALACGFFWELWNVHSLPKWLYTVPYVDRWHFFELPFLGYLGYLPFGIVCGWAVEALVGEP